MGELDRRRVREEAVRRFSVERMAAEYHRLYRAIVEGGLQPGEQAETLGGMPALVS